MDNGIIEGRYCFFDCSAFPEQLERAQGLVKYFDERYKPIFDFFKERPSGNRIKIYFCEGGETGVNNEKTEIQYSIRNSLKDKGCLVHEIAHIVQNYPDGTPKWESEVMAEYVRYRFGKDESGWRIECSEEGRCATEFYAGRDRSACGVTFLIWLVEKRSSDESFIIKLNSWIEVHKESEDFLKNIFKKDKEALYKEYKEEKASEITYPFSARSWE